MSQVLSEAAIAQLFLDGRTTHAFDPLPLDEATLRRLYDTSKWLPTAFNAQPARFVFVQSAEGKARLKPCLSPGNVAQTESASVTVIVAQDSRFYEDLPQNFPAFNARPIYEGNAALAEVTALRNSTLQAAYLMLAARALGLDYGSMGGFDANGVNHAFFPDGRFKANVLINLGRANPAGVYPRGPRYPFESVCQIV